MPRTSDEVAKFFEPSIEAIVEVFDEQQKAACMPIGVILSLSRVLVIGTKMQYTSMHS